MYALIAPVLTLCYQTSLSLPCKISASLCLTYLTTVLLDLLPRSPPWCLPLENVGPLFNPTPWKEEEAAMYPSFSSEKHIGENTETMKVTWNPVDNCWDAIRPAGPNYRCNINIRDIPTDQNLWGHIDGQAEESESKSQMPEESESS
ncbi:hypothetical protein EDB87DRAFT_1824103 [Lactarius vividus]|nr:hypothetical protein EDB87DRAFT_1824103 [Lactarius vividus]